MNDYCCESSISFGDMEIRQIPFVPRCKVVTKGLKEFDETRIKRTFAESSFIKSVERISNLKCPISFVGLNSGMEKLVIGGKAKLSVGNKT